MSLYQIADGLPKFSQKSWELGSVTKLKGKIDLKKLAKRIAQIHNVKDGEVEFIELYYCIRRPKC